MVSSLSASTSVSSRYSEAPSSPVASENAHSQNLPGAFKSSQHSYAKTPTSKCLRQLSLFDMFAKKKGDRSTTTTTTEEEEEEDDDEIEKPMKRRHSISTCTSKIPETKTTLTTKKDVSEEEVGKKCPLSDSSSAFFSTTKMTSSKIATTASTTVAKDNHEKKREEKENQRNKKRSTSSSSSSISCLDNENEESSPKKDVNDDGKENSRISISSLSSLSVINTAVSTATTTTTTNVSSPLSISAEDQTSTSSSSPFPSPVVPESTKTRMEVDVVEEALPSSILQISSPTRTTKIITSSSASSPISTEMEVIIDSANTSSFDSSSSSSSTVCSSAEICPEVAMLASASDKLTVDAATGRVPTRCINWHHPNEHLYFLPDRRLQRKRNEPLKIPFYRMEGKIYGPMDSQERGEFDRFVKGIGCVYRQQKATWALPDHPEIETVEEFQKKVMPKKPEELVSYYLMDRKCGPEKTFWASEQRFEKTGVQHLLSLKDRLPRILQYRALLHERHFDRLLQRVDHPNLKIVHSCLRRLLEFEISDDWTKLAEALGLSNAQELQKVGELRQYFQKQPNKWKSVMQRSIIPFESTALAAKQLQLAAEEDDQYERAKACEYLGDKEDDGGGRGRGRGKSRGTRGRKSMANRPYVRVKDFESMTQAEGVPYYKQESIISGIVENMYPCEEGEVCRYRLDRGAFGSGIMRVNARYQNKVDGEKGCDAELWTRQIWFWALFIRRKNHLAHQAEANISTKEEKKEEEEETENKLDIREISRQEKYKHRGNNNNNSSSRSSRTSRQNSILSYFSRAEEESEDSSKNSTQLTTISNKSKGGTAAAAVASKGRAYIVSTDATRNLSANATNSGIKYDDAYDEINNRLLWMSQASDIQNRKIGEIITDRNERDISVIIVVAAPNTQNNWVVIGNVERVVIEQWAKFSLERGDEVVRGGNKFHQKFTTEFAMNSKVVPACKERFSSSQLSEMKFKMVGKYDGWIGKELRGYPERLSSRREVTDREGQLCEASFCPNDFCSFCGWKTASAHLLFGDHLKSLCLHILADKPAPEGKFLTATKGGGGGGMSSSSGGGGGGGRNARAIYAALPSSNDYAKEMELEKKTMIEEQERRKKERQRAKVEGKKRRREETEDESSDDESESEEEEEEEEDDDDESEEEEEEEEEEDDENVIWKKSKKKNKKRKCVSTRDGESVREKMKKSKTKTKTTKLSGWMKIEEPTRRSSRLIK